jgi:hypothetical protein
MALGRLVPMKTEVIGVHPVDDADEPCHLLELQLTGHGLFNVGAITQRDESLPRSDWQVPYDEQQLSADGASGVAIHGGEVRVHGVLRIAFFFHFLNPDEALLTSLGSVTLPGPTPRPERLRFLAYEAPG